MRTSLRGNRAVSKEVGCKLLFAEEAGQRWRFVHSGRIIEHDNAEGKYAFLGLRPRNARYEPDTITTEASRC
jgi:hypothetical protein